MTSFFSIKTTIYLIDLDQIYDSDYKPTATLYKADQNKLWSFFSIIPMLKDKIKKNN
jgi:hypothetical protein